jgi:hypothetical protein
MVDAIVLEMALADVSDLLAAAWWVAPLCVEHA